MKRENEFGKAFKRLRHIRGISQEKFALASGRGYISEVERGLKHPTLKKIDELAARLEVHPLTILALSYASKELVSTRHDKVAGIDKLLELVLEEVTQLLATEE